MHPHLRRIYDEVRGVDDRLEELPLQGHGLTQIDVIATHRVFAAGLRKPAQQLLVVGDQKHYFALNATAAQLVDELRYRGDLSRCVARVEADSGALVGRFGAAHRVGNEGLQQGRRNIVDTIKAEVLEHVQSHALSGTRQAAENEDAHALWLSTQRHRRKRPVVNKRTRAGLAAPPQDHA